MDKNSKVLFAVLLIGVVLITGCVSYGGGGAAPSTGGEPVDTNAVEIKGFAFNPATISVTKGTTVTWTNQDSAGHTVKLPGVESQTLSRGESFSHTFDEAGTFDYICGIHPSMHGGVTVTE